MPSSLSPDCAFTTILLFTHEVIKEHRRTVDFWRMTGLIVVAESYSLKILQKKSETILGRSMYAASSESCASVIMAVKQVVMTSRYCGVSVESFSYGVIFSNCFIMTSSTSNSTAESETSSLTIWKIQSTRTDDLKSRTNRHLTILQEFLN